MIWETEVMWPQFRGFYVKTFDEMIKNREVHGKFAKTNAWATGENVFLWWTGRITAEIKGQVSFDDVMED